MKSCAWIVASLFAWPATGFASCGAGLLDGRHAAALVELVADRVASAHFGGSDADAAAFARAIGQARAAAAGGTSQRALAQSLNRALVLLGDAHLELRLTEPAEAACTVLPLRFAWNEIGLWVSSGTDKVPVGARVARVGSMDPAALQQALAATVPHETVQWLRAHGAQLLVREDTLVGLGAVDSSGHVEIEFESNVGVLRRERIALTEPPVIAAPANSGYRIHARARTGHFWFSRFDYDAALVASFDGFVRAAEAAGVEKVAIDIRGNPGGDSSVAVAILDALTDGRYQGFSVEVRPSPELAAAMPFLMPEAINPVFASLGLPPVPADAATYLLPGPLVLAQLRSRTAEVPVRGRLERRHLFLLTDGATFSSGTLFADLVRDNRLGEIVGGAPGNTATFNGSELRFDLPATDYYLNLSSARLGRPDAAAPAAASIVPDHLAVPDGADLAADRDVALDWVLRQ